jgi:hypothetical protein
MKARFRVLPLWIVILITASTVSAAGADLCVWHESKKVICIPW